MGDLVDLDAYRKQKEEEERLKREQEEREEYEYLSNLVHTVMVNIGNLITGSTLNYTDLSGYTSDDFHLHTYYHEAGYDENGYYEKNWELDPWDFVDDEDCLLGDDDEPDT